MDNDNESNNENMELSPEEFYSYNYCENLEINEKNLVAKGKGKIHEEIIQLYSELKSAIHPSFIKAKFTNENEEIIESIREISFVNVRIDKYTIHILFSFLQKMKIISLILNSNFLTIKNLELIFNSLLTVPNHIFNLNFEWNSKLCLDNGKEIKINELNTLKEEDNKIFNLIISIFEPEMSRLESISFRGNYIGNEMGQKIFNLMKENTNIRILNLYKNNLSNDCLKNIGEMFLYNRKLQELNLGGNFFNDKTIEYIKDYIGIYELDTQGYENILKLMEEKKQIMESNKKINKNSKPKVLPKEVPFVDEIKDVQISEEEVKHYKVRNDTIQKLDFINNPNMTQKSFNDLLYLVDNTSNLILFLDLRKYDKDSVLKMIDINGPYCNRIYLYK